MLTQDVELAEWAGLLQHQPGVHAVTMELVFTGEHPEPLGKGKTQVGIPALKLGTKTMMWGGNRMILGVKEGSARLTYGWPLPGHEPACCRNSPDTQRMSQCLAPGVQGRPCPGGSAGSSERPVSAPLGA